MRYIYFSFILVFCIYLYYLGNISFKNNLDLEGNRIEISSINLYEKIYIGYSTSLLEYGAVIEPGFEERNNLIIYGHRFSNRYPLKKYFFDIDKINLGDVVRVYLKGTTYEYEVENIFEIQPFDTWILSDTNNQKLTIITCTPVLNPKNRLVIISKLVRKY